MMNKKRTHGVVRVKYLMFIPLIVALFLLSNIETVARVTVKTATELSDVILQNKTDTSQVFVVVEQMPEFPGGVNKMLDFIKENIKYPEDAKAAKKEGRVIVEFIVREDGSLTNVQAVREAATPSLNEEALRVVNLMPKWAPGKQRGQAVSVKFTIPIYFAETTTNYDAISIDLSENHRNEGSESGNPEDQVFMMVEQMPEFPGGEGELIAFINKSIHYPAKAIEEKKEGRVIVQFIVQKDGRITDARIVRGASEPSLNEEALRVIQTMPNWNPGKQRGQAVAVKYTVPIIFSLKTSEGDN